MTDLDSAERVVLSAVEQCRRDDRQRFGEAASVSCSSGWPFHINVGFHPNRRAQDAITEIHEEVLTVIAPLGLRLAPDKTKVAHLDEGFVFLGFTIRRMRKRGTQKYYVYTMPSRKAVQAIKGKVSAKTYRSTRHRDLDEVIRDLNRTLVGWANYFRHGVSKTTFSAVDHHAWGRVMRWTRSKYKGRTGLSMKNMRRRFCDRGWRFAHNGVVFTGASSVAVTRYRYRGSKIPTPWTPTPAATTNS